MAEKVDWNHLPVSLPGGGMIPHLSGRMRTAMFDTAFQMTGGVERLVDWANHNYTDFIKLYAKGQARPISLEVSDAGSLEDLLTALDAGENAKVINEDGSPVTLDDIIEAEAA